MGVIVGSLAGVLTLGSYVVKGRVGVASNDVTGRLRVGLFVVVTLRWVCVVVER